MPPQSSAARTVAQRLIARADPPTVPGGEGVSADVPRAAAQVAAADRVCRVVADELSRWFGQYGVHALLTRALAEARASHPALATVRVRAPGEPCLEGLADAERAHGAGATSEGVTALLAALIDLLGRLIGEDMAVNLVSEVMVLPALDAAAAAKSHVEPGAEPGEREATDARGAP